MGNITSQLFANIYLNELDYFIKHNLKIKYYIRYCDDFVILSDNENYLQKLIPKIDNFLNKNLNLSLHPDKITIRKYRQGIDFLGYVSFPYHRVLRTKTKKRMFKKINQKIKDLQQEKITEESFEQTFQSYLGVLKHCNGYKLKRKIISLIYFMNFKEKVFNIAKKIHKRKVLTYKTVAEKAGYPRAWRAVGNILNKNQDPEIPCHRVIRSDGKIGGYNRGQKKKMLLLNKEGIIIKHGKIASRFRK